MRVPNALALTMAAPLVLVALACGGPPGSIRNFPQETTVDRTGLIDPGRFGPAYGGGRIQSLVSDASGSLYAATQDPYQVLRIARDGTLLWARNAGGKDQHDFQGPRLHLSLSGDRILVVDSGERRVHEMDAEGNGVGGGSFDAAYRAARSRGGTFFLYPNTAGFLLDTFDSKFRYMRSIVPLPGPAGQIAPSACLLLPDEDGGVLALWNPTRTVYRLGPEGDRRGEFTLDPSDLLANIAYRMVDVQERARNLGGIGVLHPFLDFTEDREGRLAALYLFEEAASGSPTHRAAVYRFTRDGEPVDVILGLGPIYRVAFGLNDELYGIDPETNLIHAFRIRPA